MTDTAKSPAFRAWERLAAQYYRLKSPLRPASADVELFEQAIRGADDRVLLLGITPALARLGKSLLAVEAMPTVIKALWIGDEPTRRAEVGDWRSLPCEAQSRSAIVGDGVFSAADVDPAVLVEEFIRVLDPAGTIAIRCFCAPDQPEPLDAIVEDALCGRIPDLNVLKWRLSMQLAANEPDYRVSVVRLLSAFNRLFPDRDRLLQLTGWQAQDFGFIDMYKDSASFLRFLLEGRLLAALAPLVQGIRCLRPWGYPLADRCPIVVLRGPSAG